MEVVKVHLLATVLVTQALALYEGKVPYFPIEISRTAASSPMAMRSLTTGFATLLITLVYTHTLNAVTLTMWGGLMIVALVPDTFSWALHMLGVAIVLVAACVHVYHRRDMALLPTLVCVGTVYGIRLVLKAGVMLALDPQSCASRGQPLGTMMSVLFSRTLDVMMHGPLAFGDAETWRQVAPVFKVCGVLQWVAFYALSFVL
jgi:hypothetical protein